MNTTPAEITASQIGNRAFFMMGAKNIMRDGENILIFKVGRNDFGVTHVRVSYLPGRDLYSADFLKIRGTKAPVTVSTVPELYAQDLHRVLTRGTGLDVSL